MTLSRLEVTEEAIIEMEKRDAIQVLHVDDEASFLAIAKQCLEMEGDFLIDDATSAEEAIEKMNKKTYDVIVSDYIMPGKSGLDLLKEIRGKGNEVPFIMFTGKGREEVAARALNMGASMYISKSGSPETVYCELAHGLQEVTRRKRAQENVRYNEERFRLAFENAVDAIFWADPSTGAIINCNKAAEVLLDRERSEIIGQDQTILHPSSRAEYYSEMFQKHIEQKGVADDDAEVITKSGQIKLVHITASVTSIGGKPLIQGIFRDITERKKTEEKVRESEERFRSIFENANDAIVYGNMKGKILDLNAKAVELAGMRKEQMVGKSFSSLGLISLGDVPRLLARLANEAIGRKTRDFQLTITQKNGQKRILEVSTNIVKIGNAPVGFLAVIRDITDRTKAEKAILESQQKFEGLFENNPEAAVYLDVDFKIVDVNARFCRLFGYSENEIKGRHINEVVVSEDKMEEARKLDKASRNGYASHETERRRKDGSLVPVSISAAPVASEGKLLGYVGLYKDISERKKLEEKLRVVGSLTRHDVRNKLCTLTGNYYIFRRKLAGDPAALTQLRDMETAIKQVEEIFDFASIYERLGVEKLTKLDVGKAANEAMSLFSDFRGVKVVNELGGLTILADSLLRQVFYNLIDNSLRYGEKIRMIKIYCRKPSADILELVYEDDGVGISSDLRRTLFKEGVGKGTGYGLFMIKRICEVYGWTITECGQPGKGARFIMKIPVGHETHTSGSATHGSR